ncbi:MAG: hypothetical protein JO041_13395 [Acidobacteria bacterium]|nr:hypothetical protein [Acidobacteriota bacterium]
MRKPAATYVGPAALGRPGGLKGRYAVNPGELRSPCPAEGGRTHVNSW